LPQGTKERKKGKEKKERKTGTGNAVDWHHPNRKEPRQVPQRSQCTHMTIATLQDEQNIS
jgi:hypothetical protein